MSLEVEDLVSGYTSVDILHGVSMKAGEKRITAVLGPNGCGKTTLLKTIYGFLKPRKGRVLYEAENITGLEPFELLKKGIAYVFQRRSVFPLLTVHENIEMGGWALRKNNKEFKEAVESVYDRFPKLEERKRVRAGSLSGGEQRMLEIGRALMLHPKFLILDEPSAGLAPLVVKQVYEVMEKLRDEGITILIVDQNVRLAVSLADYIYIMTLGRVKFGGPKEDLGTDAKKLVKDWLVF